MKQLFSWFHLCLLLALLSAMSTHLLEVWIVLIIAYEVGLDVPGLDKLFECNRKFIKWLKGKLDKKKKRKD